MTKTLLHLNPDKATDMIRSVFAYCTYVLHPYLKLLKSFIDLVLKKAVSSLTGKKEMLYPPTIKS